MKADGASVSQQAQPKMASVPSGSGFLGSMKKLFTFGGSSSAKPEAMLASSNASLDDLSHEQYVARNNSASSLDEDDLEGELNLSDEESNARGNFR